MSHDPSRSSRVVIGHFAAGAAVRDSCQAARDWFVENEASVRVQHGPGDYRIECGVSGLGPLLVRYERGPEPRHVQKLRKRPLRRRTIEKRRRKAAALRERMRRYDAAAFAKWNAEQRAIDAVDAVRAIRKPPMWQVRILAWLANTTMPRMYRQLLKRSKRTCARA